MPQRCRSILGLRIFLFAMTLAVVIHIFWESSVLPLLPVEAQVQDISLPVVTLDMISTHTANATIIVYRHPNFWIDFPLCLVHIGKAAGSSVSCGLGLTYADCEGMPRDQLPHTYFFHMRRNRCPRQTRTYVVTLRNPLTRLQSWFDFEKDIVPGRTAQVQQQMKKQRNMIFQDCFPTFEKLIVDGLMPIPNNVTTSNPKNMTCTERAWAAVMGVRPFSYHEWYNYEYYWTGIGMQSQTTTAPLYALRLEHLQEDWSTLSQEPLFRPVNRRQPKSKSTNHTSPNFLSENASSRERLCHALCDEIQYYKQFLMACVNLNPEQRQQSLAELQQYCPLEDTLERRDCPNLPSFPKIPVAARQYRTEVKKRLYEITSQTG